jgi:outer membrane protein assembly factor BamE (lipoprotein component of BamABCDE complex)
MSKLKVIAVIALAAMVFVALPGCAKKVTKANYDKIEMGMTLDKVEGFLGKADECKEGEVSVGDLTGGGKVCTWKADEKTVTVTFDADGKVVAKAGF